MSEILAQGVGQRQGYPLKKVKKVKEIKQGSVVVKIYRTPKKGQDAFTVAWYGAEGRERKVFAEWKDAEEHARTTADQLDRGHKATISMDEMAELQRAKEILKPFGVSVDFVASQWAKASLALGDIPYSEPVEFYFANKARKSVDVVEAVAEFVNSKRQDGIGDRHQNDLESRLNRFAADNPGTVDKLTPERIDGWLRGLQDKEGWSAQTRNHYRSALLNFLGYARRSRWLSFTPSDFADFAPAAVRRGAVEIFTPEETDKLLRAALPRMIPSLAIALFCGLRPSEIHRVTWEGVDLKRGHVYGFEGKVRTAGDRLAPLPPNAVEWLTPHKGTGKICDYDCLSNRFLFLAKEAGVEWIHDGPRHSFVSYRLAILSDIARVSEETGTNATTLRKHYRRPVPREEAEKYFAIVP